MPCVFLCLPGQNCTFTLHFLAFFITWQTPKQTKKQTKKRERKKHSTGKFLLPFGVFSWFICLLVWSIDKERKEEEGGLIVVWSRSVWLSERSIGLIDLEGEWEWETREKYLLALEALFYAEYGSSRLSLLFLLFADDWREWEWFIDYYYYYYYYENLELILFLPPLFFPLGYSSLRSYMLLLLLLLLLSSLSFSLRNHEYMQRVLSISKDCEETSSWV